MIKKIFIGLTLSILIFFSISFISVLASILIPINQTVGYTILKIGLPWTYYEQFMVGNQLHHGWKLDKLILDCVLTWLIVNGLYYWKNKKTNANTVYN